MEHNKDIVILEAMLREISGKFINEQIESARLRATIELMAAKEKEVIEDGGTKPKAK